MTSSTGPADEGPTMVLTAVGTVVSPVTQPADAARQADEGAPECSIRLEPRWAGAASDLEPGDRVVILTWLHLADRTTTRTRPRGDAGRPETGVFSTRSPDRPNPIGLHEANVTHVDGDRVTVDHLEAVDGTPVLDIKPVLGAPDTR